MRCTTWSRFNVCQQLDEKDGRSWMLGKDIYIPGTFFCISYFLSDESHSSFPSLITQLGLANIDELLSTT